MVMPLSVVCIHFYGWAFLSSLSHNYSLDGYGTYRNDSTKITFEDDKYQVTIIEALFATQMDKIQIMEHCGPFYHKVYSSDLYDVDTDKLKSKAAIEDFLKEQEREK